MLPSVDPFEDCVLDRWAVSVCHCGTGRPEECEPMPCTLIWGMEGGGRDPAL